MQKQKAPKPAKGIGIGFQLDADTHAVLTQMAMDDDRSLRSLLSKILKDVANAYSEAKAK